MSKRMEHPALEIDLKLWACARGTWHADHSSFGRAMAEALVTWGEPQEDWCEYRNWKGSER